LIKENLNQNFEIIDSKNLVSLNINNKSLKEIENEIINYVLKDENHNKKAAAERLDIGRTTLWRKITK
jgi:transcriptional regulator with PAS, ATPase and Fis domain